MSGGRSAERRPWPRSPKDQLFAWPTLPRCTCDMILSSQHEQVYQSNLGAFLALRVAKQGQVSSNSVDGVCEGK